MDALLCIKGIMGLVALLLLWRLVRPASLTSGAVTIEARTRSPLYVDPWQKDRAKRKKALEGYDRYWD